MGNERKVISEEIVSKFMGDIKPVPWYELWFVLKPKWYWMEFSYWCRKQYQKWTTGFSHHESYDFFNWHAELVVPRLKFLRNNLNGCPAQFTQEDDGSDVEEGVKKWEEILDKIIWSFENADNYPDPIKPDDHDPRHNRISYDDGCVSYEPLDKRKWDWTPIEEHEKKVKEGLNLFAEHYMSLWD